MLARNKSLIDIFIILFIDVTSSTHDQEGEKKHTTQVANSTCRMLLATRKR